MRRLAIIVTLAMAAIAIGLSQPAAPATIKHELFDYRNGGRVPVFIACGGTAPAKTLHGGKNKIYDRVSVNGISATGVEFFTQVLLPDGGEAWEESDAATLRATLTTSHQTTMGQPIHAPGLWRFTARLGTITSSCDVTTQ